MLKIREYAMKVTLSTPSEPRPPPPWSKSGIHWLLTSVEAGCGDMLKLAYVSVLSSSLTKKEKDANYGRDVAWREYFGCD
jgi:hypothetical protein